ncbi:hypothetical protein LAZ67_1005336 [Cordylochernes scorpioides]|uniref:Uncharacterized protein n=1 Tax=Cordylochernes scorpioides TaxID=51811 RepID=A0ABY6JY54_9ARAC|nr:hypothetical protein LAZ67_1005336 [Cordylochernes scorpioides]
MYRKPRLRVELKQRSRCSSPTTRSKDIKITGRRQCKISNPTHAFVATAEIQYFLSRQNI